MKKTIWLVTLSILIIAFAWGKEKTASSLWTTAVVNIDGKADDWSAITPITDDDAKVEVSFQNDAKNLYVYFVFHDRKTLSTFAQTGMTIWLNPEGKKKKNQGILFRGRQIPAAMMIAYLEQDVGKILTDDEKTKIMAQPTHIIRQTFYLNKDDIPFPISHPTSPVFTESMGSMITLEYRIPFNFAEALPQGTITEGIEPGKEIMIGFEWGGMTRTMKGKMMQRQAVTIDDGNRSTATGNLTRENDYDGMSSRDFTGMNRRVNRGPKVWNIWLQLSIAGQQ